MVKPKGFRRQWSALAKDAVKRNKSRMVSFLQLLEHDSIRGNSPCGDSDDHREISIRSEGDFSTEVEPVLVAVGLVLQPLELVLVAAANQALRRQPLLVRLLLVLLTLPRAEVPSSRLPCIGTI